MLKLKSLDLFLQLKLHFFVITERVKYQKKVLLGTSTEFQVLVPVNQDYLPFGSALSYSVIIINQQHTVQSSYTDLTN